MWLFLSFFLFFTGIFAHSASPEKLRIAAENAFATGKYQKAGNLYSELIKLEPRNERLYYKRFRVFLSERKYGLALKDLSSALLINPQYKQGLMQRGKLNLMLGSCPEASKDFEQLTMLNADDKNAQQMLEKGRDCEQLLNQAESAQSHQDFETGAQLLGQIIDKYAVSSPILLMERAQFNLAMGKMYDVISDSGGVLKLDSNHLPALKLRGDAYYSLGDLQSLRAALQHFRQGLKSDPENKGFKITYRKIKKVLKFMSNAQENMDSHNYKEAIDDLERGLKVDKSHREMNKDMFFKLCTCFSLANMAEKAKEACQQCVDIDGNNAGYHSKLGEVLLNLEEFEESVREYQRAVELDENNNEHKENLQKAQTALKRSKTKDFYKILGVKRSANDKEIKRAYRKKALEWHPDKHTEEKAREIARQKFQDIAQAYEVLSDQGLRERYDRGEDVTGSGEGGGGQHNPFHHFQQGGQTFHFTFG